MKNDRLVIYLNTTIDGIFKILPLYEEENIGLNVYIDSLLFEIRKLDGMLEDRLSHEYISLILILESIRDEISKDGSRQNTIKREVFKSIGIVKSIIKKLEDGD